MSATGSITGLGNYVGVFELRFNGQTATGKEALNMACGAVVNALSGTKRN